MKRILQGALVSRPDGEATLARSISSSASTERHAAVTAGGALCRSGRPPGSRLERGRLCPSRPRGREPTAGIQVAGGGAGSAGPKAPLHILADRVRLIELNPDTLFTC